MGPDTGLQPIPGYTLTQRLGDGAFGDVWEATAPGKDRVALKFLDCRKRSAAMVAGEVRILRGLTTLQHPHIIPLLGVHAWGQFMILVMERADSNLDELRQSYLAKTGYNIPPDHALELLDQAASALDFISGLRTPGLSGAQGMQHCDIKPTNLLLVGSRLKVADFGLCAGTGWQTHTAGWRGTPPFAAPELYRGAAAPGTDQFALAVTFCQLVMGEWPFYQRSLADTPPNGIPIDLTKLRDHEYPVISRALHMYPSARFPSCKAFIDELRKVIEKARPGSRIYPRGLSGSLRRAAALKALASKTR